MSIPRRWTIAMDDYGVFTVESYRGEIINSILGEVEVIEAAPVEVELERLHRIEQAARDVLYESQFAAQTRAPYDRLREALGDKAAS